ncbi:hypothetical protein LFREDSHE_32730 [Shewanella baltica]
MDWLIIALAGFLGGMLNAVAGGGSFITLLALVFVGVPPIAANATGQLRCCPGISPVLGVLEKISNIRRVLALSI